ncbi:hypothetical protein E2C01_095205 [Portunus trituberculatus]|uniref:Uncharacterized protein n=1 Tax=Portunus trituberculatus TaxID=210409 RepID=A0A5B7JY63_PORTR|nr:hypothetical protein [Portunus trituberculatus]
MATLPSKERRLLITGSGRYWRRYLCPSTRSPSLHHVALQSTPLSPPTPTPVNSLPAPRGSTVYTTVNSLPLTTPIFVSRQFS